jgi:hypothetical protein
MKKVFIVLIIVLLLLLMVANKPVAKADIVIFPFFPFPFVDDDDEPEPPPPPPQPVPIDEFNNTVHNDFDIVFKGMIHDQAQNMYVAMFSIKGIELTGNESTSWAVQYPHEQRYGIDMLYRENNTFYIRMYPDLCNNENNIGVKCTVATKDAVAKQSIKYFSKKVLFNPDTLINKKITFTVNNGTTPSHNTNKDYTANNNNSNGSSTNNTDNSGCIAFLLTAIILLSVAVFIMIMH